MIPHDFFELNDTEMSIIVTFWDEVWASRKRHTMLFVVIVVQKFSEILGVKSQTNQPHSSAQDRLGKLDGIKF